MNPATLRAWWAHRQGLDGSLEGATPARILERSGWAPHPLLPGRHRAGARRPGGRRPRDPRAPLRPGLHVRRAGLRLRPRPQARPGGRRRDENRRQAGGHRERDREALRRGPAGAGEGAARAGRDPGTQAIAWAAFGRKDKAVVAVERTERYVRDELGDARSFSLDSPKSRAPRIEALRRFR